MPLSHPLMQPEPLRDVLARLSELSGDRWLYIASSITDITLDTPCSARTFDSREASPEERDEFDAMVEQMGLRSFLCGSQLEDIIINLKLQRADYTPQQLAAAIDYYWRHDAFIDVSTDAA